MPMSRGLSTVILAGVTFLAAACGGDSPPTATARPVATPTATPTAAPLPTATPTATPSGPQVVELGPSRDTTIYDEGPETLANGAGEWIFAGATRRGAVRRALVAFDVASAIPAGATVQDVTLTLTVTQTTAGDEPVALYRLLTAWSAGTADAETNEGKGGPAGPDDATWLGTGVGDTRWATPGGDIASAASASEVGANQAGVLTAAGGESLGAVRRRLGAAAKQAGVELTIKRQDDKIYFWRSGPRRRGRPKKIVQG